MGQEAMERPFKFIINDFDYIVVQLTDIFREDTKFEYKNQIISFDLTYF